MCAEARVLKCYPESSRPQGHHQKLNAGGQTAGTQGEEAKGAHLSVSQGPVSDTPLLFPHLGG